MQAWIGLGSNLGQPASQLCAALGHLQSTAAIELTDSSGFYRTSPWGNVDQGDFVNAVVLVETTLQPHELLKTLLNIEKRMGRERAGDRWGPRCIDLDLLTYNDLVMDSPELVLPHPRMHLRAFVLHPMMELDPVFVIPGVGPVADCLASLHESGANNTGPNKQEVEYLGSPDEFCDRSE